MNWRCAGNGRTLVVRCEGRLTAFEVRAFAAQRLQCEPSALEMVQTDLEPDVTLRWAGDDYAHGGTPNRRRLQELVDGKWMDT